jgi:hypothetical protein
MCFIVLIIVKMCYSVFSEEKTPLHQKESASFYGAAKIDKIF